MYFYINCLTKSHYSASNETDKNHQKLLTKTHPIEVTKEVSQIDNQFRGIEIAPNLIIPFFKDTVREFYSPDWMQENYITPNNCAVPLFYGHGKELYYIFGYKQEFGSEEKIFSEIWYVSENSEPKICAANLISLLLTIIECYETGAYYTIFDEKIGTTYLKQDKSRLENIFRKFNPDYINIWQETWNKA